MAVEIRRAKRVVAFLRKNERDSRDKPKKAPEKGNLEAVETLAQQLDERAHDRKEQAPDHHQQSRANRRRQPLPAGARKLHTPVVCRSPWRPNRASRASRCAT